MGVSCWFLDILIADVQWQATLVFTAEIYVGTKGPALDFGLKEGKKKKEEKVYSEFLVYPQKPETEKIHYVCFDFFLNVDSHHLRL